MKISIVIPAFNEECLLNTNLVEIKTAASAFTLHDWEVEFIECPPITPQTSPAQPGPS